MDLSGHLALITGASRGIGAETARRFVKAGARVVLLARSQQALVSLAAELGPSAIARRCDVSNWQDVSDSVEEIAQRYGPVDILVNNAGTIAPIAHLVNVDPIAWKQALDVNLTGTFHMIRAVLPHMVARQSGTILGVSSGAAHRPVEGWSHYCAAKAGAAMLTRTLDLEHRADGIRAIGLSPGTVATQMQREIKASGINPVSQLAWEDHIPPQWPASALLWMCSAAADPWLGKEISLRDPEIRSQLGLKSQA